MVNGKVSKTCISAHIPTNSGNTKSTIIVWDWAGIEGQFCILCSPHQYYYNFPVYQQNYLFSPMEVYCVL